MTCIDHRTPSFSVSRRIARIFETPFARRQRQLAERIASLRALTDEELARLGLQRDEILAHVFRAR